MAISRTHVWASGEVLLASDLNAEFNGIITGGTSVAFPLTANVSFGGYTTYWDVGNTIGITGVANGLSLTGGAFNTPQGNDIASAATLNLDTATGNLVDVTGTATVTAITLSQGRWRWVRFTGALTLTHGASLVMPSASSILTAAGDYALFFGYASSVVRCAYFSGGRRVPKRVLALAAGSATPAINTDSYDNVHITAQSAAITSFTTNLTGTPVTGDTLAIDITDNGTARALTFGASFEASDVPLPTTTVISVRLDMKFEWNVVTTKWRIVYSSNITSLGAVTMTGALTLKNQSGALIPNGGTLAGDLLFDDNAYDIGKTGATRPRDLFLSRNLVISGTLIGTSSMMSPLTNSLSGNVALNNTANYFNGPSVAQGTSGTWLFIGTVTLVDTSSAAKFSIKLTDGTTTIASTRITSVAINELASVCLSGFLTSPAANVTMQVKDETSVNGQILFNSSSGNSKDSTLTAIRIG